MAIRTRVFVPLLCLVLGLGLGTVWLIQWNSRPVPVEPLEYFTRVFDKFAPKHLPFKHKSVADALKGITIVTVAYKKISALKTVLRSWKRHGLLDLGGEKLAWIQKVGVADISKRQAEVLKHAGFRVVNEDPSKMVTACLGDSARANRMVADRVASDGNVGIGPAVAYMVCATKDEFFLLLEPDFQLIQPWQDVTDHLFKAAMLLREHNVHAVRFRSRFASGYPNWAEIGSNDADVDWMDPQLRCMAYHWIPDVLDRYPDVFARCPPVLPADYLEYVCVRSLNCGWTNNPVMMASSAFLKSPLYAAAERCNMEMDEQDNHCFERSVVENGNLWRNLNYTVALGAGLFSHMEPGCGG